MNSIYEFQPEDAERFALKRGGNEARDDHAVTPGLARTDGVEEARDGAGEVFRAVICHEQELVDELAAGVAPAGMRGRSDDEVVGLVERHVGGFAVDFAGRGHEEAAAAVFRGDGPEPGHCNL